MGGVSGSATAYAVMESRILGPDMIKSGYSRGYAAAINGLSALVTATISPSLGLIIYGSVGEVSIGRIFAAGIIPGFLMMAILMITVSITAKKRGYKSETAKKPTFKEVITEVRASIWALIFPVILIVCIRFGFFTLSEVGAFATMYAIFVGVALYSVSEILGCKPQETVKEALPFYFAIIIVVLILILFPQLVLYIPNKIYG